MASRFHLLLWCAAIGIVAFVCLDYWSQHNTPLYKRLEAQWREDVLLLESTKKLPGPWYDVKELEIFGGTPESKDWLARIQVPLKTVKDGHYKLEVLVVVWEEDGKRGTLVQYDLIDLKTKNDVWELGRTFILSRPRPPNSFQALIEDFRQN